MQTFQKLMWLTLISSLLLIGTVAADEVVVEETEVITIEGVTPSGTLVIDETQVAFIIGGSKGSGTLLLGDHSYSFKTHAANLGSLGVSKVHIVGDVYYLNDLEDFAGHYFAAAAGATMVKGKGALTMKNDKGVVLRMKAKSKGADVTLGIQDFKITME